MLVDLEKLVVSLEANLKQYERELARAQGTTVKALRKIEQDAQKSATRVEGAFSKLGASFKGFALGAVGALSIERLVSAAGQAVRSVAKIGDQARQAGVSAEALQKIGFAAEQAGSSIDAVASGMAMLNKRVAEAKANGGDLARLFAANNLTFSDDPAENFLKVADLVKNARSEIDKTRIATLALGRSGAEFIQLLEGGSAGIRAMGAEASDLGAIFSNEVVARAKEIEDRFTALQRIVDTQIKGAFVSMADETVRSLDDIKSAMDRLGEPIAELFGFMQEIDSFVREYGPFSDRARQGTLFGGQTVNRAGKSDLMANRSVPTAPVRAGRTRAGTQQDAQVDAYRRAQQAIEDYVSGLRDESRQLEIEIATIGMSNAEKAKYVAIANLSADVSAKQRAAAEAEAAKIAELTTRYEALQRQQELIESLQGDFRDALGGLFQDIGAGVKPIDALTAALGRLAQRLGDTLINAGLDSLFGGSGAGGLLAGIFHAGGVAGAGISGRRVPALAFAGAPRYHAGGIAGLAPNEVPAILQRGERIIPRGAGAGSVNLSFAPVINMQGNVDDRRMRAILAEQQRAFERRVPGIVMNARRRAQL